MKKTPRSKSRGFLIVDLVPVLAHHCAVIVNQYSIRRAVMVMR